MQGKVMSEHSASSEGAVGIDVCKASLDVHILPANTVLKFANNKKGHRQLITALNGLSIRIITLESTSKYHRSVHRALHTAGCPVALVNPLRSRLFAEAIGALAKTDSVDARMLATYGQMTRLAATPPLPEALETLREIVRAREAAVAGTVVLKNQLAAATVTCVRRQINRQIKAAERAVEALKNDALAAIAKDPAMARRLAVLTSIPGIAEVTAAGLIANMPELGQLDAKQVGMLAGLAPVACDSGMRNGPRHIRGGRAVVRTGIYMAALSAARHNPGLRRFHERLVEAGKANKVALTAVMRKLLVLANTLLKEDRLWTEQSPIARPFHA